MEITEAQGYNDQWILKLMLGIRKDENHPTFS